MHYIMLVTLLLPEGGSSEKARATAHHKLLNDDSFCGEGGLFGSPLADWFYIGGRWSGMLHQWPLGQPYQDALKLEFPDLTNGSFLSSLLDVHKTGLDQLWHRFGGTGSNPLTRNRYGLFGSDDDAMLVDPILYNHFLKPHAGSAQHIGDKTRYDFADLDRDEVDESFIGRKWLVVVDYHN